MKQFKISNDIIIECESYSTRSSWGHKGIVYYKGLQVESGKIVYQNRTWERYQFESMLYKLLDNMDKSKCIPLKDRCKIYQFIKHY